MQPLLTWHLRPFDELSLYEFHDIIQARLAVFSVEQKCFYQDVDGKDIHSHHLFALDHDMGIAAIARIVAPGISYDEPSLGRVLITEKWRGTGLGRDLLEQGILACHRLYPGQNIRISAQAYLENFYKSVGFETISEPYMEDDIPHIQMLLTVK